VGVEGLTEGEGVMMAVERGNDDDEVPNEVELPHIIPEIVNMLCDTDSKSASAVIDEREPDEEDTSRGGGGGGVEGEQMERKKVGR